MRTTVYVYEAPITELDPMLSILHVFVHLILTTACEIGIHHLHLTDEKTEAQRN